MEQRELALVRDEDLDLQTFSGLAEAKRRGLLPDGFNQSPAEYDANRAAFLKRTWELRKPPRLRQPQPPAESQQSEAEPGPEWQPQRSACREHWQTKHAELFAKAEREAIYQLRERRSATRRELARVHADLRGLGRAALPPMRFRGSRGTVRRPAARRSTTRARAPTGDGSGSEPPGPDDGPGDDFTEADARHAAAHVVAVYPHGLTPARFRVTTLPFTFGLDPEQGDHARLRIFLALPDELPRAFYRHLKGGTR